MTISPGLARIGLILAALVVWEIAARAFGNPLFMAPPSETFAATLGLVHDPGVVKALFTALWELAAAFGISVVLGTAIAIPLGLSTFWRGTFYPFVLFLYAVPQVTVLPLFIKIFGFGPPSKIAFGVTHGVFIVLLAVLASMRTIDPVLLRASTSLGANRRQLLTYVVLPHLVPSLFTGMRLAMSGVLLGVMVAELYISSAGVGYYSQQFANAFAPAKLFGLVGLLAGLAIVLNESMRTIERRFSAWREPA
jgi:ABC-type nitrate/sulfonate/bicarbonate transport system permease component